MTIRLATMAAALAMAASAASAQDGPVAEFSLGAGVNVSPSYFGSDDYEVGPTGDFRFDFVRLPGGFSFGSTRAAGLQEGFGLRGSARYIGSRKASSDGELRGLEDVDATLELGLGLGYDTRDWRAFGVARYGFFGHEGFVGQVGADALYYPTDQITLNVGPRADFGDTDFMGTYFGVTEEESAASVSGFDEYDPSGGLYSVGMEVGARYAFSDAWGVEGRATYNRFVSDASDSPIVEEGSDDDFGVSLIVTRSISLGF